MEQRPDKAFKHTVAVTWGDCDPAKIVYTGRLPWFALDAINGWWVEHLDGNGWFQMELDKNIGTPFVRLEMDIKKPVTPRSSLICYAWPVALGTTSISFRVDGEQNNELCFGFKSVSVFTVASEFRKQAVPNEIRELITPLLPPNKA